MAPRASRLDPTSATCQSSAAPSQGTEGLPSWLLSSESYEPSPDRDHFITRSMLSITATLARLRLDDGQRTRLSPGAPTKLLVGLALILLTSLSTNYAFVLVMVALALGRVALLPAQALKRVASVAFATTGLTALVMLPAVLLGQTQSLLLVATKVLVSVSITLTVALSTPVHELTGALRQLHVSNLVIMTVDLALKSIVTLGSVALEVLRSLRLRSVGRNSDKGTSLGGIGGVVFLKAHRAAQDTADAMRCRGFEGEYRATTSTRPKAMDLVWLLVLMALVALFAYLQGQV